MTDKRVSEEQAEQERRAIRKAIDETEAPTRVEIIESAERARERAEEADDARRSR